MVTGLVIMLQDQAVTVEDVSTRLVTVRALQVVPGTSSCPLSELASTDP